MAVTLQARRIKGDQFTANDEIELLFNYTELGTMYEALTTIESVSGVAVTHGGGEVAGEYLHYKAYDLHGDDDGFIDYSTMNVQVVQAEKGTSTVKATVRYVSKATYDAWVQTRDTWRDTYVTEEVLADGTVKETSDDDAPDLEPLEITSISTGNITLTWGDDTLV